MPAFVLTAHVSLYLKCLFLRFPSLTLIYSRIHRCIHDAQYRSATGTCMGNQVMRCVDVAHKKGPLSRGLSVWWCFLSSALLSFAGFESRPKGMGRGGGGVDAVGPRPKAFQDWSRSCLVCGFGLLCIHTTVRGLVFKVWRVETGWEEGHRRDNSTAKNHQSDKFWLGCLRPLCCSVPQKWGGLRKWGGKK